MLDLYYDTLPLRNCCTVATPALIRRLHWRLQLRIRACIMHAMTAWRRDTPGALFIVHEYAEATERRCLHQTRTSGLRSLRRRQHGSACHDSVTHAPGHGALGCLGSSAELVRRYSSRANPMKRPHTRGGKNETCRGRVWTGRSRSRRLPAGLIAAHRHLPQD